MYKKSGLLFVVVAAMMFSVLSIRTTHAETVESSYGSLPSIVEHKKSEGTFKLEEGARIVIVANEASLSGDDAAQLKETVQLLNSEFAAENIPSSDVMPIMMASKEKSSVGDLVLELNPMADFNSDEMYTIEVSDRIHITGKSVAGVFYGARTVMQTLMSNGVIEQGLITDYPALAERSFHIDMARKFYTPEWFKQRIIEASWLKLNQVQMHFSENEGFRIESEEHPEIMSDEYYTKDEVREMIELGKKYHVEIVPSFDTPGHLRQVLRNHPEFQLEDSNGNRFATGLDITSPDGREFVKSIYSEYAELFKDSRYFHIGGDEFIVFDKYYQYPKLEQYAKENIDPQAHGVDTFYEFINEMAAHVKELGFIPRAWNDGLYRIDQQETIVQLDPEIQITYWTSWDPKMAPVQDFLDRGHDVININDKYFYYVVGNGGGYQYPKGVNVYNEWHPGLFPSRNANAPTNNKNQEWQSEDYDKIAAASFAIWSDRPRMQTEEQVTAGIKEPLRAMAERSWNGQRNTSSYADFKILFEKLGYGPGYDSRLPDPSEIYQSDEIGKLTVRYLDEDSQEIAKTTAQFGDVNDSFKVEAIDIYGYKLADDQSSVEGKFTTADQEINFVYRLYVDKTKLEFEIENKLQSLDYIEETYEQYESAYQEMVVVYNDEKATQLTVDDMYEHIQLSKNGLILKSRSDIYDQILNPIDDARFTEVSYQSYQAVLDNALSIIKNQSATDEMLEQVREDIKTAISSLELKPLVTVTANKGTWQNNHLSNVIDGKDNTILWIEGEQKIGDVIQFNFREKVRINKIKFDSTGAGLDVINGAEMEISLDGETWSSVGSLKGQEVYEFDFEPTDVAYARIRYTKNADYWTKITHVKFSYATDTEELKQLVASLNFDETLYVPQSIVNVQSALAEAQRVLTQSELTQYEVDLMVEKLQNARLEMVELASIDRTALEALLNDVNTYIKDDYNELEWAAFAAERASAQRVLDDLNALQPDIDAAFDKLSTRKLELVSKVSIETQKLEKLLNDLVNLDALDYTKETFDELERSKEAALLVLSNEDRTVAEIEVALTDLNDRLEKLILRNPADFEETKTLVSLLETARSFDKSDYSEGSYRLLEAAINKAETLFKRIEAQSTTRFNKPITRNEVSAVAKELEQAIQGLEIREVIVPEDKPEEVPINKPNDNKEQVVTDGCITTSDSANKIPSTGVYDAYGIYLITTGLAALVLILLKRRKTRNIAH